MALYKYDVILLTESRYVNPSNPGDYVQNILNEDLIVADTLKNRGLSVSRVDWADPEFDWSSTKTVLFRTTWDYFDRFQEFKNWLNKASTQTRFINSSFLINWNIDKHYLDDLANKGIHVVPTRYINKGSRLSMEKIHEITGWVDTVIKPTIGGTSRHTYRVKPENLTIVAEKLRPIMKNEDFMLQPFQYSILDNGEWSFVFFGENFSHVIQKKAKVGDFRVQDDFGGTIHPFTPTQSQINFAQSSIKACPDIPAYTRVDIVIDNDGELAISELELIEPELWFRIHPEAAEMLADEVLKRLNE